MLLTDTTGVAVSHQHWLPTFTPGWEDVFAALLRQYLFIAIYCACAGALANQSASRMAAMQHAEQHIN